MVQKVQTQHHGPEGDQKVPENHRVSHPEDVILMGGKRHTAKGSHLVLHTGKCSPGPTWGGIVILNLPVQGH